GRDGCVAAGDVASSVAAVCQEVSDPARLRALTELGLSAEPDAQMEEFAHWVRESLDVPVALVSLVREDAQVFPGMVGLAGSWAQQRSTPLTHSFCQHVVRTARPLIITDAREDPLVGDNLAVPDLGVIAYAGMPLTDQAGRVLGSLCAIDVVPRAWTAAELRTLERIAQACAVDLRLRLSRFDQGVESLRRDAAELVHERVYERSQSLLLAAQQFSDTATLEDVVGRIQGLLSSSLRPTLVSTLLVEGAGRVRRMDGLDAAGTLSTFSVAARVPAATAIREGRLVHHPDRTSFDAANSGEAADLVRRLGLHTCVAVPLPGPSGPIGAIALGWSNPAAVDAAGLLTLASIAGYAGQAFARAGVLRHRVNVAHELQNAMLTTLPTIPGLELAARYAPADSREHVGGDWYDAAPLPNTEHSGARAVAVSVGDIIGHTLDAAAAMGQTRSMLRQAAWDHPGGPPTAILKAFEAANAGLGLRAAGTALVAHLHDHADGTWSMKWTNAGHPPPILLAPDGTAELLTEHDALFGFPATAHLPRVDHGRDLPTGATLFLYTDGLIEHRDDHDIDAGIDTLVQLLRRLHDQPTQDIVDTAVDTLAPDAPDDVVAFAIRISRSPQTSPNT
ncbi:MAG: hypothetical protein QOH17_322, partial [Pseudonocardiales bacterium]|nr:hypothetical protein [Pseudonocardiales bacterium]